ncbi:hypothetical protein P4O66_016567 [Electrophorus voltai]|uniref:ADF-H domain-containing protein n=1 Tax=Electrophorus voltai TaxID=2609070 RepID=A0AAD9DPM3_9TELE|nr:hypothetical protein P4O66_016567 [Electrophorus voltai]
MYGFCSLKEPAAALPRYILINWVGEDVPDARKCACASHVATIAEFFQGVDVIINASSVDDIDPSAIGQRLTNGTGPAASPVLSRLRMKDEENTEHVGTTYQKTNAEIEMKKINREEFWEQAKREEEMRKEEERKKAAEERQRFEEERMELERKEQEEREKRYQERERQIEEHRQEPRQKKMQEEEQAKENSRPQPVILRTEPSCDDPSQEKKESEVEEAAAIIAQRTSNPREYFKQREKAVAGSVDASPITTHRTGRLDSPFLRQMHSPCETSPPPFRTPPTGRRQLGTPGRVTFLPCVDGFTARERWSHKIAQVVLAEPHTGTSLPANVGSPEQHFESSLPLASPESREASFLLNLTNAPTSLSLRADILPVIDGTGCTLAPPPGLLPAGPKSVGSSFSLILNVDGVCLGALACDSWRPPLTCTFESCGVQHVHRQWKAPLARYVRHLHHLPCRGDLLFATVTVVAIFGRAQSVWLKACSHCALLDDPVDEGGSECILAPVSVTPIPKIAIQEDKEESSQEWVPESPQRAPVQECGPAKPVQSVAPQASSTDLSYAGVDDGPLDPWDSGSVPAAATAVVPSSPAACLVDLMADSPEALPVGPTADVPQALLSFDEVLDAPFCPGPEDDPSSLVDVDVAGSHQMTLSYQQALQHASASDSQDLDDSQLLMTNGDTLLKEGTQASEGYFSQSQEEDFAQSDECSAKVNPTPVFYNKPPEIDITCWDTDPVVDDED